MLNWGGHHNGYDEQTASSSAVPGSTAAANLSASYNADARNHMGAGGGGQFGGGGGLGGAGGGGGGGAGYGAYAEHLSNVNRNTERPERMVWSPDPPFQMTPEEHLAWMGMGDQEKKKLERKRARNRQAASKCRQKKMDRIKELEDQVTNEKHRGQRLDAELVELQRALDNFRRVVERHAQVGCSTQSIRA